MFSSSSYSTSTIAALQASTGALFEAVFEGSADALFISTDEDDTVVFACNQRAVEMFDAPDKQALMGRIAHKIRQKPPSQAGFARHTRLLDEDGTLRAEVPYITFKGKPFWGEFFVRRIPIGQDFVRLTRIIDISEQKRLQSELEHTNEVLADAQSITKLGTWEFDIGVNEITWSDETFRLYGLEPRQGFVSRQMFWSLVHPEDAPLLREAVQTLQQTGKAYKLEIRGLQPDGSYHFHEAQGKLVHDELTGASKILGTVRNINEDKRKEAELLYNQERLQNIINNISEVIIQLDFNGIIEFVSENWQHLTGIPVQDALQRSFVDFIHQTDATTLYKVMTTSLSNGIYQQENIEYRVWHKGKQAWMWHSASAAVISDTHGVPKHILATARDITEQKRVAEQLQRSKESLSEAQEMAHLGNWHSDIANNTVEWSEEMYRIFGLPVGSPPLEQQEMAQMLHPDDRGAVARALRSAVIDQAIVGTEMRIFRSDGVLRWLDARVKPVIDESTGRTTALFGTIWDITERKLAEDQIRSLNLDLEERVKRRTQQLEETNSRLVAQVEERTRAEEALQISQNNLRTLIESTHDAIWSIDREYRFTTVNAAFYSVLRLYNGYEVKINDSALFDTIGIPSQKWLQYYNRVLQGERFMAQSQYQLAGYIFDIEISFNPIINEESSVVGAVVFARDITDRLRVEREIRDSEALLNLILETVVTGIALTSNDGVIIRANRAFAQMLGYTPRELIGRNYTIVVPEQRRTAAIQSFEQTFQNNAKMTGLEIQLLRQNGELIDVEMSQTVVTNETNEAFVISSINNITERKEAENEIRRALEQERELRAMQSRFVVMVSHEFRTPLTTIRASAQLLERNRDKWSADKQESYFQDIDDAVNTMTVLLEDVLSWGKADARRIAFAPEATNICELLDSIVDGFRVVEEHHERVVVLAPRGESPPRLARIDAKLIRQIVSNLLANALKYSPLETSIECEMILDAGSISFRVADKGIGISEEDQKHLFEPFYRAGNVGSIAGTGLGLAIVRQAVELHGGTIHCTSAIGVGTEFIVVIPCTFS